VSIPDLLESLAAQGIELRVEGDRLRFRAPRGALSAEQRAALGQQREEVIAALRARASTSTLHAPLSFTQQSLWFVHQAAPSSAAYNVALAARVTSPVDPAALRTGIQALVDRHAVLRTTYEVVEGTPLQRIAGVAVAVLELHNAYGEDDAPLRARIERDYQRPFDLARGPVIRASLYTRGPQDHVLLLTVHHIAADAWSLLLLLEELRALYPEATGGAGASLPLPSITYADYVKWQEEMLEGPDGKRLEGYWIRRLAPPRAQIELTGDRPRPAHKSVRGSSLEFRVDSELALGLKRLARDEGTTLFVVLLAAFKALLFRYTGTEDVVVGTPTFGRGKPEFARIVGHFVNPLPLRTQVLASESFRGLLGRVRQTLLEAIDAQEYPLALIVERLQPERDPSRLPLFDTFFVLQRFDQFREFEDLLTADGPSATADFGGLRLRPYPLQQQEGQFDLALEMVDAPKTLLGAFKYSVDLFDRQTIARLQANLEQLLIAIARDPGCTVQSLPLLTAEDERLLVGVWNDTAVEHDRGRCVHQLLEASARATPGAPAVVAGGVTIGYRELDERANRLAHLLVARGVVPGARVAICVDRTVDMPVAMAAVLKAGAAYVPLDPGHPAERLQYTLEDADVACALTLARFASLFDQARAPLVLLDEMEAELAALPTSPVAVATKPEDLAYVIYTSGSTGRPKGVQVEHRNVVSFLEAMRREPGFTDRDVLLAVTTLSFDIAELEFWLPLSVGGRVVIASRTDVLDGERLMALLQEHRVTVMQATPATWRVLLEAGWTGKADLKILCGGEVLARDLAAKLTERVAELWNMYGPTETTIWSTLSRVENATSAVPIGRPIANTTVYVLEPSGLLAPTGVPGELCIGGEGVARGYRNRPELTAEKFATITLPGGRVERVYRTGDVVRFRGDGQLEFIGRRDHQVKVRGFRIELGEIEATLAAHPGVKECVVTVREDNPGDQRLIGYIVVAAGASFDPESARVTLRTKLPEYMIPNAFMVLAALPLTPNGKVDRKVLPAPEAPPPGVAELSDALMTSAQRRVAGIWRDVLRVDRVGLYDNFYDLGGHSLLLVKVHAALKREFGGDLALVELFQRTTVAAQADRLSSTAPADGAMRRARARAARQVHG
jgi:amino acid adenylation domain-containing protein